MNWKFLDLRYGTLGRLDYFLFKYIYLTIAVLIFMLPPFFFGLDYVSPVYLLLPAYIFIGYLSFLFDIKRLRDIGWSFWLMLIPLSPLFIVVPIWFFPDSVFNIFNIMEKSPFAAITIVIALNLFIMTFQALLLFVRGQKYKSPEVLQNEYERDIKLEEECFKSKGTITRHQKDIM